MDEDRYQLLELDDWFGLDSWSIGHASVLMAYVRDSEDTGRNRMVRWSSNVHRLPALPPNNETFQCLLHAQ